MAAKAAARAAGQGVFGLKREVVAEDLWRGGFDFSVRDRYHGNGSFMTRRLLVRGARQLLTLRGPSGPRRGDGLKELAIIENGAMVVEGGLITAIGPARRVENLASVRGAEELDVSGRVVMPGFVDSHTHLVHGPPRLEDFTGRIAGRTYQEIAAAGGGILASVRAVRGASAHRLRAQAARDLQRMAACGTTVVEAKSGYALDAAGELRCLRILQSLDGAPVEVVPTFLGAHWVPPEFEGPEAYTSFLVDELLPLAASKKLARFADVYCDRDAFPLAQARRYLEAARRLGLGLRIHAAQFHDLGAVALAVELGARSVDHLENIAPSSLPILAASPVIATLLPGSVFHLGLSRYAPARTLIDSGAAVALATDFNPGTSPTWNMQMILALACTQMRMTPAEAISAATINAAHALGIAARTGSLEAGKQADFIVLHASDYRELPYYFGANQVALTVKRGAILSAREEEALHVTPAC